MRHLCIKCIILPRQARDKHGENSKKEWRFPSLALDYEVASFSSGFIYGGGGGAARLTLDHEVAEEEEAARREEEFQAMKRKKMEELEAQLAAVRLSCGALAAGLAFAGTAEASMALSA